MPGAGVFMKKEIRRGLTLLVLIPLNLFASNVLAKRYELLNKPLDLYGQVSQSFAFGWHDDFDTETDINAAIWTGLVEGAYYPWEDFKLFGQFILTGDLIYGLKACDDLWRQKQFDQSWRELALDDSYWQILKEFHATWTPGYFLFRIGKQIISWGQTDGIRLMDQINPLDLRRGFADVEFETTIIPIWMLRADYFPPIETSWLQDLSAQFWLNPNAGFIPTQNVAAGNNVGGIWAPYVDIPLPFPGKTLLGSADQQIDEPDEWSDGQEFGIRIQGVLDDTLISLNGFYGRENEPILLSAGSPSLEFDVVSGINLLHPKEKGFYPDLRFVGATLSRDLTFRRKPLFGISPVVRMEAFYAFGSTFVSSDSATGIETLEEHDELRWAIGLDWKIRLPMLSPSGIIIQPQFFQRHIFSLPSKETLISTAGRVEQDNYAVTLFLQTAYLNERLPVSFFWLTDIKNSAGFFKPTIGYLWDKNWTIETGAMFLYGDKESESYQVFDHKDYIYMTLTYKWG